MNTGAHLWWIPAGDTPNRILGHPALQGVAIGNTGSGKQAAQLVTPTPLFYTGDGSDGMPYLYAVNKSSGVRLGQIQLPASGRYGMMTYMHQGRQHVLVQTRGGLVALALPLPAGR